MNVKRILIKEIIEAGGDGLYSRRGEENCGCGIDDLMPCEYNIGDCVIAKLRRNKTNNADYYYPLVKE